MFWQQRGGSSQGHTICVRCTAHKAHIYGQIRYGLTVATVDPLLIFLHSCNYPVFPFAFTLSRPSGNFFYLLVFPGTFMKALASSFVQSFDTS